MDQTFVIDLDTSSRVHVTDLDSFGSGFSVNNNDSFIGEIATFIIKDNPYGTEEYHYRQGFFNLDKVHHIITIKLKGTDKMGSGSIRIMSGVNNEIIIVSSDINNGAVNMSIQETGIEAFEEGSNQLNDAQGDDKAYDQNFNGLYEGNKDTKEDKYDENNEDDEDDENEEDSKNNEDEEDKDDEYDDNKDNEGGRLQC